ncbi:MAG TPA: hypothetical protein DHV89_06090 [Ruminococcus sp.]|nr:hypothetical protein [Ruminococcus sp.]
MIVSNNPYLSFPLKQLICGLFGQISTASKKHKLYNFILYHILYVLSTTFIVRDFEIISIITTNFLLIAPKRFFPEIQPVQSHIFSERAFHRLNLKLILANSQLNLSMIL